jgi:hypothetical protein
VTFRVIDRRTGLLWDPTRNRRRGPETRREKPRSRRGRRVEDLVSFEEIMAGWDEAFPETAF